MNAIRVSLYILMLVIFQSCVSLVSAPVSQVYPQAVDTVKSKTNLVLTNGDYWIIGMPQTNDILGSVFRKTTETYEGKSYDIYQMVASSAFTAPVSEDLQLTDKIGYSKDYSIKNSSASDLVILSYLSGGSNQVSQIDVKTVVEKVAKIKPNSGLAVDQKYMGSEFYFVNSVYQGTSSYVGLQQTKINARFSGFDTGASFDTQAVANLHEIKQGVVAIQLMPISVAREYSATQLNNDLKDLKALLEAQQKNFRERIELDLKNMGFQKIEVPRN